MSEDGKLFIFSYGDEVYSRGKVSFNGTVLGYVRRLNKNWYCIVETKRGNIYLVSDNELSKVKSLPEFVPSKH